MNDIIGANRYFFEGLAGKPKKPSRTRKFWSMIFNFIKTHKLNTFFLLMEYAAFISWIGWGDANPDWLSSVISFGMGSFVATSTFWYLFGDNAMEHKIWCKDRELKQMVEDLMQINDLGARIDSTMKSISKHEKERVRKRGVKN